MRLLVGVAMSMAVPVLAAAPPGVTYVPAPAAVNARAKATLERLFAQPRLVLDAGDSEGLALGPWLGQRLGVLDMSRFQAVDTVADLNGTTSHLKTWAARTPDEAQALLALIAPLAPTGKPTIRPMTAAEMKRIWPFIAWDLTEPIFVVEGGAGLTWVDDLTSPCFSEAAADGTCVCTRAERQGRDWALRFERQRCPKRASLAQAPVAGVELRNVQLLQPDAVMAQRVLVEAMAEDVAALERAVAGVVARNKGDPMVLAATVAVQPGGRQRVWLNAARATPPALRAALQAAVDQVAAPATVGVVVFQLQLQLWGGPRLSTEPVAVLPDAWRAAAATHAGAVEPEVLAVESWQTR